jgi:predicted permease
MLTGLLFGLAPALTAARVAEAGGRVTPRHRLRSALVMAQVGLSVALLASAALLGRSFLRAARETPGFRPERLVAMRIDLPPARYADEPACAQFYRRTLGELGARPGVDGAVVASAVPMRGSATASDLAIPGRPPAPDGALPSADWRLVSPGHFRALGIPLRGRDFESRDDVDGTPLSIIVSEELARRSWPGDDAIGKTLVVNSFGKEPATVVGVAGDVKTVALDEPPRPTLYAPAGRAPAWRPMYLAVRTSLDAAAAAATVREVVGGIDPTLPVHDVRTLTAILADSLDGRRFSLSLVIAFAGAALALACIGLFGVMTQLVLQRRQEIGIRAALGARPSDIQRLVLGRGLRLAGIGAAAGLAAALWLASALEPLLYEVRASDPVAFGGAAALLLAVAALASWIPARRATRVDPVEALRAE